MDFAFRNVAERVKLYLWALQQNPSLIFDIFGLKGLIKLTQI